MLDKNDKSSIIRNRKRKKLEIAAMQIQTKMIPELKKELDNIEVFFQDPPDRDETFIHHDLMMISLEV